MKCKKPFNDGSDDYKIGDNVLNLPELDTETHYAVGTDMCRVYMVEKEYLEEKAKEIN